MDDSSVMRPPATSKTKPLKKPCTRKAAARNRSGKPFEQQPGRVLRTATFCPENHLYNRGYCSHEIENDDDRAARIRDIRSAGVCRPRASARQGGAPGHRKLRGRYGLLGWATTQQQRCG